LSFGHLCRVSTAYRNTVPPIATYMMLRGIESALFSDLVFTLIYYKYDSREVQDVLTSRPAGAGFFAGYRSER
ncbi:hypothetical protein RCJ22_04965, partial [Vibrio sp. FNV 38]|nr:hypothetical protein [Vibrio sp. FNV 38]